MVASIAARAEAEERARVSIPFIAGQWSLPATARAPTARRVARFNPLHCGAVVASLRPLRGRPRADQRFNPLHCGAVVASCARRMAGAARGGRFQSPSLRGSGRFKPRGARRSSVPRCFNPLHCGAVVASVWRAWAAEEKARVSIPFIAGQWSLLRRKPAHGRRPARFQSPSLRGSGRF